MLSFSSPRIDATRNLDANPLTDIASTRKIAAVVSRGTLYERAALDEMLEEAKAEAAR